MTRLRARSAASLLLLLVLAVPESAAFTVRNNPILASSTRLCLADKNTNNNDNNDNANSNNNESIKNEQGGEGPLGFIMNPYESKIPKEIEAEIYAAEANTDAAQDRNSRIALYAVVAFTGILGAFFNVFLSELRAPMDGMAVTLDDAGFGWVQESNFLVRFLFLNKIGGGLLLLSGAGAGLLAEAEYDTRRLNAEKIFEEMKRRRESRDSGGAKKRKKRKKKRRSGKEVKRLGALAEIVETEVETAAPPTSVTEAAATQETKEEKVPEKKDEGILGKIKGFYERADNMAASQALLLNKKLEDEGLIDKITDESGLKVIGKEAAAKVQDDKSSKKDTKD